VDRSAERIAAWVPQGRESPEFAARLKALGGRKTVVIGGVDEGAHAFVLAMVDAAWRARQPEGRLWVLCSQPRHRERLAVEMELWGAAPLVLADAAPQLGEGEVADPEGNAERLLVLEALAGRRGEPLVLSPEALDSAAPQAARIGRARRAFATGATLDPQELAALLATHGFEKNSQVQGRGQFALRGGIFDLFPWQAEFPLRLEFFDTTLESIREFDLDTQTSRRRLERAEVVLAEPENDGVVRGYLHGQDLLVWLGEDEPPEKVGLVVSPELLDPATGETFPTACHSSPLGTFGAGDFVLEESRRARFFAQLAEWRAEGWQVGIVFSNKGEEGRFTELAGEDLLGAGGLLAARGDLVCGFAVPALKVALLSSAELFGRYQSPGSRRHRGHLERQRVARARASLEDITEGDLVVHSEYGIGRYQGVQTGDEGNEEIVVRYKDGALLAVPLDQAHLISRYVGIGGKAPELNRLGGTAWKKTRQVAEKSILDYAAQLLRMQAERQAATGHPHAPDSRWMWEFENSFHFTETPDQRSAIEQTKRDMESPRAMDRLICGDVGFGKTEVALRAAFKAVTGGKQVAILVPTTVLAEQHWRTFRERMSDYPIRIDLLNRFRSGAEIRQTLAGLADGSVDIVIGTHRLISGDVVYKDLGLAVVDEEQRFGVQHKERFKEMFRQIDVLTLSATPIPRTLYMALMGARDMSTIDTPPPNRVPVNTRVVAYDERLIRDGIRRELKRGGQVFFLHNRVKTIDHMRQRLLELVPEARIIVGHGQMEKDELEVVMRTFVSGEADILLATTIIESGIDIPNANTIFIDRADRFGLADLYQLRGRVGRAGEKAYAVLLLPRDMVTAGDARKRINAIKQYTALGSGFKIAMRDLEIRGAGNLLGTRQSGHISAVGFDLYCQLLRQSVDRLQGRAVRERVEVVVRADFLCFSEAEMARAGDAKTLGVYLPSVWLPEARLRISAYKELASLVGEKDLERLVGEWRDRFGRFPAPVEHLIEVARLKLLAAAAGISAIEIRGQRLMLTRNGDYIMLEGRRFPRLPSDDPGEKLAAAVHLLRTI
jgi:transcription-repair coupling factor (superfamily II helicase)